MNTAAALNIEIVADLSSLEAGLRRSESNATRSANKIANDLGKVDRATGGAITASQRLAQGYSNLGMGAAGAATASSRLAAANDNVARSADIAAVAARGMALGVAGIITALASAAIAAFSFAAAASKVGMEMAALERGFAASAGSAQQGGRELTFVRAEADRLGLSLGETAKQYMQMVAASQGTAMQGQGTRDIFVAISTAMTVLGKSAADAGGALNAVQQMMSKGSVQSEELKGQLGERLPGAFNLAAQAMGKTTAEFQKMLEDGDVLAEDLLPKLAKRLIETYGAAAKAGSNELTANLNRLGTAWNDYSDAVAKGGLNDALNRAAQSLATLTKEGNSAAAVGAFFASVIDGVMGALVQVPRFIENLGILAQMARETGSAFAGWASSFAPAMDTLSAVGTLIGASFSGSMSIVTTVMNGIVGASVAGYQLTAAAWNALPAIFGEIAAAAGNALIAGIEAAVNFAIAGLNKLLGAVNAVGAALPDAVGFKQIAPIAEASFGRIESASAGAAAKVKDDFSSIASSAMSKDYIGAAGKAITDNIDGQVSKFRELRSAQDATNHLLREAGKIAGENKVADAYKNAAAAGKASKKAAEESGGAAKDASSAYEQLIQRTKDRIEELQLEAQYASKTATEVIKLKLAHDLERAAKKDGTAVTDAMRAEWDRLGDSLAAATQKMEAAKLAQQQLKDGLRETAEGLSSLFKDLAGGKGFDAAIKSFGSRSLESVIDGLLTGKGSIGVALGLALPKKAASAACSISTGPS